MIEAGKFSNIRYTHVNEELVKSEDIASILDMSGSTSLGVSPATPLAPHLALQKSRPRRRSVHSTTPHALSRSPVGALLLCDLKRSAARALTSHSLWVAGPFSRHLAELG